MLLSSLHQDLYRYYSHLPHIFSMFPMVSQLLATVLSGVFSPVTLPNPSSHGIADLIAFVQFCGFGIGFAAFVYGLATNLNGKCIDAGHTFCQVVRITLGFVTLTWYLFLPLFTMIDGGRLLFFAGFCIIIMEVVRPKRPAVI